MGDIPRFDFVMAMAPTVESGKPNKGFGGARRLYGDLRDNYPETCKHLEAKVRPQGSQFKTQAEQIAEAKKRIAEKRGPVTEEMKAEEEKQKKVTMLRHKCGVGGRRTPNGGFFT